MLEWVLHNTFAAAVLSTVVLVAARFLRARPAVMHLLWLLVVVRLVAPPLAWPPGAGSEPEPAVVYVTGEGEEAQPWDGAPPAAEEPERESAPESGGEATKQTPANPEEPERVGSFVFASGTARVGLAEGVRGWLRADESLPARRVLLLAWLAGALVVLLREARGARRVQRLVRTAPVATPTALAEARAVAREIGVAVPPIRAVGGLRAPFVWSFGRPVLLIGHRSGPPPARSVLAHELAHLKRRDHWTTWIELAALCVHWWNPVLFFARRRMRACMELACDAWVVRRFPGERVAYARALLDAASHGPELASTRAFGVLGPDGRAFEARLAQILHADVPAPVPRRAVAALALLCVPALAPWARALPAPPSRPAAATDPALAGLLARLGVGSWSELEARGRERLAAEPRDGEAAKDLGLALLARGAWAEGAEAFRLQIDCGFAPVLGRYNLACAHALQGEADPAFEILEALVAEGAVDVRGLRADPDLERLRRDARWERLVAGGGAVEACPDQKP